MSLLEELDKKFNFNIHIRYQQRNAKKYITSIEGLTSEDIDVKNFIKKIKKTFGCGANKTTNKHGALVIQIQGDQRRNIYLLLQKKYGFSKDNIIIHG